MSTLARPRGKLPARVYWFRRGLVLVVTLGLVFGIGKLLGGGAGAGPDPDRATVAAAHPTTAAPTRPIGPVPVTGPRAQGAQHKGAHKKKPARKAPLAQPTGDCAADEVWQPLRAWIADRDEVLARADAR